MNQRKLGKGNFTFLVVLNLHIWSVWCKVCSSSCGVSYKTCKSCMPILFYIICQSALNFRDVFKGNPFDISSNSSLGKQNYPVKTEITYFD